MESKHVSAWIEVEILERLDEMAKTRGMTQSGFIELALASVVWGKSIDALRSYRAAPTENAALDILASAPHDSNAQMVERLQEHGIRRTQHWVSTRRKEWNGG